MVIKRWQGKQVTMRMPVVTVLFAAVMCDAQRHDMHPDDEEVMMQRALETVGDIFPREDDTVRAHALQRPRGKHSFTHCRDCQATRSCLKSYKPRCIFYCIRCA